MSASHHGGSTDTYANVAAAAHNATVIVMPDTTSADPTINVSAPKALVSASALTTPIIMDRGNNNDTNHTNHSGDHRIDHSSDHHTKRPYHAKKVKLLVVHGHGCPSDACWRWCVSIILSRIQRRFASTDKQIILQDGVFIYRQPCPVAKEIYLTHYSASKNAHKKNRRQKNRWKKGHVKRYVADTDSGVNRMQNSGKTQRAGKVIPRRSWKLAIAAFRIMALHLNATWELKLNNIVYHSVPQRDCISAYYLLRSTCKELSLRLPIQIPSVRDRVVGFRLQYLNILRIDQYHREPCSGCGEVHARADIPVVRVANLISLHSVLSCNTELDNDMRRDIYYKTRMFATVSIQRWWRRNVDKYRSRHRAEVHLNDKVMLTYGDVQLKNLDEEKQTKHQIAIAPKAKNAADKWRRQRKHAQQKRRGKRKTKESTAAMVPRYRHANWRSDKSEAW